MKRLLALIAALLLARQAYAVEYTASKLRDPFYDAARHGGGTPADVSMNGLVLQGVVRGPRSSQVIINEKVYREGEFIGTAQIIRIDKDAVLFKQGDQEIYLKKREDL